MEEDKILERIVTLETEQRNMRDDINELKGVKSAVDSLEKTIITNNAETNAKIDRVSMVVEHIKENNDNLCKKIVDIDSNSKFDIMSFIKTKLLPIIITGGIVAVLTTAIVDKMETNNQPQQQYEQQNNK